jgi:hypothetical protein
MLVIPHIIDQFIWSQRVFELGGGRENSPGAWYISGSPIDRRECIILSWLASVEMKSNHQNKE